MQYDANDEQKSLEIFETWHYLMKKKRIQVKKVFERIPREDLTTKQLQDPIIASSIEKFGYYDAATTFWPEHSLNVLDFFVELGYVDKFLDNIHQISYHHGKCKECIKWRTWFDNRNDKWYYNDYTLLSSTNNTS
jgi:hypothetical protein